MDDTVAVALITSLSTLAAAGLAGVVSAWTNKRQLQHEALLARDERAEQRATDHRERRREAYERFLAQADAAYRVLDDAWFARPPAHETHRDAGFAARRTLDEAYVRVQLVGPEEVAEAGAGVVRGIGQEFRLHTHIADAHPDTTDGAADLDSSARTQAVRARFTTTREFVAAARRALGGELS